ncbi:MAG: SGNH/GDSL hydrolase family protein [Bacteroidia bacterium]
MNPIFPSEWLRPGSLKQWYADARQQESVNVICYGDSITFGFDCETGLQVEHSYPSHLQHLLQDAVAPQKVRMINAGHNGWTSEHALGRVHQNVLARRPDLVIVMFGVNDAYQDLLPEDYRANMAALCEAVLAGGAALWLLSPTPVAFLPEVDMPTFVAVARDVADKLGVAFFDLHEALTQYIVVNQIEPEDLLPDGIHFSEVGYTLIGDFLATAWRQIVA